MTNASRPRLQSALKTFSAVAGGMAFLAGCLVLTGWALDRETLKRILPQAVAMNPATAAGFILAAIALAFSQTQADRRRQNIAQATAGLVALIGFLKLADILFGWRLGIDEILFRSKLDIDPVYANRMAPTTAVGFVLLGLALVCLDWETRRRRRPAQFLALALALIALLAVVGYLYGVRRLTGLQFYIPMAIHTAVAFLVLSLGVLCLRPDRGLMARVTGGSPGGVLLRRMLPAAIGIPVLLGWLIASGQRAEWYDPAFAFALFVVLVLLVFSLMIWASAVILDRKEVQRCCAEDEVRQQAADLTQANAELEAARQAAEAASLAKGTFLANMSHEIRTPLNAVIGMTELVLKSPLSIQQREFLQTVKDSGEALLSVINDILDFSKIEAGKFVLDNALFDLRESLGDTMKSFALRAQQRGLELTCFIHPELPDLVVGDYNRLRQVIVNLVGNALKFTEKGEVGLEVSQEALSEQDVVLHFVVSDTGIGIPEGKRQTVFEMFEQADSSTTRRHGGTGLGLAIAARLVGLMDGRIWLESEVGRGSRFHFLARLALGKDEPREVAAAEAVCLQEMRVLVVDDNATNRRILEETLRSWRMVPTTAAGGEEALELMRRAGESGTPYRLVVTDAHMPSVDGFALAERIKQDAAIGSTVIMMLTSGDRPDDVARCGELGIAAYMLKPVKQSELLEAIELAAGVTVPRDELLAAAAQGHHVQGLRILLAEDSLVNQKLAVALLEGQGHTVTLVNNGKEAVAAADAQAQILDLILMDVQMPEMDGLEAAAAIRARERTRGTHLPIIAMTAHALKGDRERCLEAGMDNYVSKPIRAEELFDAIDAVFADRRPGAASAAAAAVSPDIVQWNAALKAAQGNRDLLRAMTEAALEEIPRLMAAIRQAIAAGDPAKLRLAGHTLKGAVRYFGADDVCQHAAKLEDMGHKGELAGSAAILAALETDIVPLTDALVEYLQGTPA